MVGVDLLVGGDHLVEVGLVQVGVLGHSLALLGLLQRVLERAVRDFPHDVAVHLDEAAIGIAGEAGIARLRGQAFDRGVVETEVEDRVHHARHGLRRPRANAHQQRIAGAAERAAHQGFQALQVRGHLVTETVRIGAPVLVERRAHLGGEREPRRHRDAQAGHLGEVRSLAAEQLLHVGPPLGGPVSEEVDVLALVLALCHVCPPGVLPVGERCSRTVSRRKGGPGPERRSQKAAPVAPSILCWTIASFPSRPSRRLRAACFDPCTAIQAASSTRTCSSNSISRSSSSSMFSIYPFMRSSISHNLRST